MILRMMRPIIWLRMTRRMLLRLPLLPRMLAARLQVLPPLLPKLPKSRAV